MSYLVLARKYRPQTFDQVVGQEGAATSLRNAIEGNRVGQAFLFAGPRGVGKTSMARILAKALNCEKGPTVAPCGKCEICKGIEGGRDPDIQEIDAATYSKVENIRDLRETIPYGTMRARFKVLIVDEVHRLSAAAFDALLKVLEEPPAHVKFVFATTEIRKVPDTILSRCQVFDFRRIEDADILAALAGICKKEKIKAEEPLLRAIAQASRGGLRDALTLLDQVIAFAGDSPALEDLEKAAGLSGEESLFQMFESVLVNDRKAILEQLDRLWEQGGGEEEFLNQWIDFLRQLMLARSCGAQSPMLQGSPELKKRVGALAEKLTPERIDRMLTLAFSAREKTGYLSGKARVIVELALLKTARVSEEVPVSELLDRLAALERRIPAGSPLAPRPIERKEIHAHPATVASTAFSPVEPWKALLDGLKEKRKSFADVLIRKGSPLGLSGERFRVAISDASLLEKSMLADAKNLEAATRILEPLFGKTVSLSVEFQEGKDRAAPSSSAASHPAVKQALDLFEGKVVEER